MSGSAQVINVLLIDGDAAYAAVVKESLQPSNGMSFNFTWLNDGGRAVTYLKSPNEIHVILMDYYIGSRNGMEVLAELRAAGVELPVIMLTGGKDFRIAIEAMRHGVTDYIAKEEAGDSLLPRAVVNALQQHQLKTQVSTAEKNRVISRRKTEAVQELVVTMCHEFNNPLAAIKISTDILTRQCKTPEVKALLSELNTNISSLERQIVKLRDLNLPPPPES